MDEPAHIVRLLLVLLVGCGGSTAPSAAAPARTSVEVRETRSGEPPAASESAERTFLEGRFVASIPEGSTLTPSTAWSPLGATFDAYEFERAGCSFAFALRSDGWVRPMDLQPEGAERWLPREDTSTAILALPERTFTTLSEELAAVGAVAFEADGSATDLWVWPLLPPGEASAEAGEDDDWLGAQRRDPRISNCFGEAERWLAELLPTLRPVRPFVSPSEITFGWDDAREEPARYRATLPAGWVLSSAEAYDAEFTFLHPRLPWARSTGTPTPNACLWLFTGDDAPPSRGRRVQVLGRALAFDAEGCARFSVGDDAAVQNVCLTGSAAERAAILEVLETFRPVTPAE